MKGKNLLKANKKNEKACWKKEPLCNKLENRHKKSKRGGKILLWPEE